MALASVKLNIGEAAILGHVKRSNPFRGTVDQLASDVGIPYLRAWNALMSLERLQLVRISKADYGLAVRVSSPRGKKRR